MMSIVGCIWTTENDKVTLAQEMQQGDVVALINAKSSDFGGKSMNLSEESKIFVNPHLDIRCG
jgi:hypothetical protein